MVFTFLMGVRRLTLLKKVLISGMGFGSGRDTNDSLGGRFLASEMAFCIKVLSEEG
jgi:hypothetical protein